MCLITLAYKAHADFLLIMAANRDEFLAAFRPSLLADAPIYSSAVFNGRIRL